MLTLYQTQVQNLLGTGATGNLYSTSFLNASINEARRQVAMRGQCVRALSPIAGPISAITVSSGGSGFVTAPIIGISQPDFPTGFLPFPNGEQAAATATISGGSVATVGLTNPGAGYFMPAITITSGGGAGASAAAIINNITYTNSGQEQYSFASILPAVQSIYSGIQSIVSIRSVAFIWGTYRYVRIACSFSRYQAYVRTYSNAYEYIPAVVTQYGQGVAGTLFMYPVPNSQYQFECDCSCLPIDLVDDTTYEAIPQPWQDCVQYYATYKAFLSNQRWTDAKQMYNEDPKNPGLFQRFMVAARQGSMPTLTSNPYGRS